MASSEEIAYYERLKSGLEESVRLKQALWQDENLMQQFQAITSLCVATFRNGGKVLFCGNGGSAADAQHLAAELSGRYYFDRPPLFAEALAVNSAFLTAVSNDYSYEMAFARMLQAIGAKGDVLFALSTSGNSPNILKTAELARQMEVVVIGMTGADGGQLAAYCDYCIKIPSKDTPRIQECHMLIGHLICELIEQQLFGKQL
ncbi:MAG TPA: D-sedoheptulose 7-phosphate isomerase [Saprospiraceae bacterium]|nr:D-sedoheptulose 7-phosphate isomerase [Saprospiraceae bacterium]HMQ84909.1 D-sedoheptulose 7-phosphate isomerase [Saprospiraceae bacterium]